MIRLLAIFFFLCPFLLRAELVFETNRIEHTAMVGEEEFVAVFPFTNEGDETVTIANVHSTCGCTVPKLSKKTYASGESGQIEAVFTYGSRVGPQSKAISIVTGGDQPSRYQLRLMVNIPTPLTVKPRVLNWRADEHAQTKTVAVMIGDGINGEVKLDDLPEGFTFELRPDEEKPGVFYLDVTPDNSPPRTRFSVEIVDSETKKPIASQSGFLLVRG